MQDLQALGDMQREAAAASSTDTGSTSGSLTWQAYERHAAAQLAKLEQELPVATTEAHQLQVAAFFKA